MRRLVALLAVSFVLATAVVPVAGVHTTGHSFTVQLAENGDATVVVEDRYNFSNESQREAFEAIASNETRQQERRDRVARRLDRGAAMAANASGRDVRSGEVTVNVTETDDEGIVRVRGSWTNVAAVNTKFNILELRQPFQSGFQVNRTLVVSGPDEYTRVAARPAPSRALKSSAYWSKDADLSSLFVRLEGPTTATVSPADGGDGEQTATVAPVSGPGLSVFARAAAVALIPALLVVLALRRAGR